MPGFGKRRHDRSPRGRAMTPAGVETDRKDGTPERVWVAPDHIDWEGYGSISLSGQGNFPFAVEYIRADLHTARIAALEAANRGLVRLSEAQSQMLDAEEKRAERAEARAAKAEALLDIVSPLADQYRDWAERLRAALRKIASHPAKSYFHEVTATDGQKTKTVQTERVVSEVDVVAMMDIARAAIAADTQEADHE
jgi:hypothetical protein